MAAAMRGRQGSKFFPSYPAHAIFFLLWLRCTPPSSLTMAADVPDPPATAFLKDVVKTIAASERWDLEAVRVSGLDIRHVRVGSSKNYDFYVRAAGKSWAFRFPDDPVVWKKVGRRSGVLGSSSFVESGTLGLRRGVGVLELEGPLELLAGGDDDLSLRLPLNTTHVGLKRILIGEGIKIRLEGAEEVIFVLPSNVGLLNRTSARAREQMHQFQRQSPHTECPLLLTVYVQGLASVAAHQIRDPGDYIETEFHTPDILELLSENYHDGNNYRPHPVFSIHSFSLRLNLVEKILGRFIENKLITQDGRVEVVKAKIASSTIVRVRLELEREINSDDRIRKKVAGWKTRPRVERALFEVVARVEEGKPLKPLKLKRMREPQSVVDTTAWSNLMSNISFTEFSSVVVPPEPLTLDVKW